MEAVATSALPVFANADANNANKYRTIPNSQTVTSEFEHACELGTADAKLQIQRYSSTTRLYGLTASPYSLAMCSFGRENERKIA